MLRVDRLSLYPCLFVSLLVNLSAPYLTTCPAALLSVCLSLRCLPTHQSARHSVCLSIYISAVACLSRLVYVLIDWTFFFACDCLSCVSDHNSANLCIFWSQHHTRHAGLPYGLVFVAAVVFPSKARVFSITSAVRGRGNARVFVCRGGEAPLRDCVPP